MAPPCAGCYDDTVYAEITYDKCKRIGRKAILLQIDTRELWIPYSLLDESEDVPEAEDANPGSVFVAEWYAIKEGLV